MPSLHTSLYMLTLAMACIIQCSYYMDSAYWGSFNAICALSTACGVTRLLNTFETLYDSIFIVSCSSDPSSSLSQSVACVRRTRYKTVIYIQPIAALNRLIMIFTCYMFLLCSVASTSLSISSFFVFYSVGCG